MNLCKRTLAGLTLLVSAAMLLVSLAGGVSVWIVKGPVTDKATRVFGRVDAALDVAEQSLDLVSHSLGRAAERLDSIRAEHGQLARHPQPTTAKHRALARTLRKAVVPELGDAHKKVQTIAETAVVVNSVLEDVGNLPFLSTSGLDVDRLAEMNKQLASVGPAAWDLSQLLDESEPDSDAASNQLSRVEQTVNSLKASLAEYASRVTEVRQRTEELKSRTFRWMTPAAMLISVVCFQVALAQLSLLCHAWSWWKHARRDRPLGRSDLRGAGSTSGPDSPRV
jgi:hypothetical protein